MWHLRLHKFLRLGWVERALLLEAGLWLALAQLGIWLVPFRRVAPLAGRLVSTASAHELTALQVERVQQLGWAVRVAARLTPWDSKCLAQALVAKTMLRRRRLPGALVLGVAKSVQEPDKLEAHAWVRCGPHLLTGGPGHERFTVVAIFE